MTLREAYEYGQEQLKMAEITEAALDAWYLLEYVSGVSRAEYFLNTSREVSSEQVEAYVDCIGKRASHIPLQHITGVQEFMGLPFAVNEHVLVPRQDTEVLVESVLDILKPGMHILDMCTGSGCILISLLKLSGTARANKVESVSGDGKITGIGVDISTEALKLARKNAETIGVEATFLQSDLFTEVQGQYDVIVSNPPYIRTAVIQELKEEVKCHDPLLALDGKEDGLYFYRKIIGESLRYLKAGGRLYFEIGHDQAADVKQFMEEAGFSNVMVKKDLAGLDRVVFGVYNQ